MPQGPVKLFVILILGLLLRLFLVKELFPFDFDQQASAYAAYDFFINYKITLIGQELSFPGFFIGPLYNWVQFLPYGTCNLLPDCIPYFMIALGLATASMLYFVTRKLFDNKIAIIASGIYSFSFTSISNEIGVNGNSFLFPASVFLLFCLHKYFLGKDKYLLIGSFVAGVITVNFNPIYIFSSVSFFVIAFLRAKRNYRLFLTAALLFFINYWPLIIFNFRHENILLEGFKNFVNQNQNDSSSNPLDRVIFLSKDVLIPFYSNFLFQSASGFFKLSATLILLVAFLTVLRRNQDQISEKEKLISKIPLWILITFLGLTFYKGHIPDYYFQQTLLPFIILVSLVTKRSIFIFLLLIVVFLFTNMNKIFDFRSVVNYQVKKQAVSYIIDDSQNKSFNVYYDLPQGLNTGYDYLFKAFKRQPQEGGENLYILSFKDPSEFLVEQYYKSFPDKKIAVKSIGFVQIVSVK